MRRNNTLFDVKPGRRWARLRAPGRTGFARARHGIGAFSGGKEAIPVPCFGESGRKTVETRQGMRDVRISAYVI